jgi:MFS family permease
MSAPSETVSLWRDRNYAAYRLSRAVSGLGSQVSSLAFPLLVLSLGGGPVRAGAVGTCAMVTRLAFQLPAGQLADRFDLRWLMFTMDLIRLVAVGSIPLAARLDHLSFAQLVVVAVIEGGASAVFGAAAQVFIRVLVPMTLFSRAMGQAQASNGMIALLGPILGGALFEVDRQLPFVVDTGSYLLSGLLLLLVSVPRAQSGDASEAAGGAPVDRRFTAGIRWLWDHQGILRIAAFGSVLNLVGATMGVAALVVMSQQGTSSGVIGLVMSLVGAGAIAGSLASRRIMKLGPARLYLGSGLLWTACLGSISVSSSPWVIAGVFTLLSIIGPSTGIMLFQILASDAPKSIYGRVSAAQQLIATSLSAGGPLVAGVLIVAVGGRWLWLILGGLCLIATLLTIRPVRALARARSAAAQPDPAPALVQGS